MNTRMTWDDADEALYEKTDDDRPFAQLCDCGSYRHPGNDYCDDCAERIERKGGRIDHV